MNSLTALLDRALHCTERGHAFSRPSSRVGKHQLAFPRILDEDRQQLCWLRPAGIARDAVMGARSLIEALTRSIDTRPFVIEGAHDLARHDVSVDEREVRMPVRRRSASRRIDDFDSQERFSRNIREHTFENGRGAGTRFGGGVC